MTLRILAKKAADLSRAVYSSLPWGYRVANMLIRLAASQAEIFGRVCYWTFLEAGVEGLPDINGQPALLSRGLYKGQMGPNKLPKGYGSRFGQKVWAVLLKKYRNVELIEDAISLVSVKLASKKLDPREGSSLSEAEGFVLFAISNEIKNMLKKHKELPYLEEVPRNDEEADNTIEKNLADPSGFKRIEEVMSPQDWARLMKNLEFVHERAPEWAQAQVEGVTNSELARQWGVTPAYVSNWLAANRDNIQKVFKKHLRDAS